MDVDNVIEAINEKGRVAIKVSRGELNSLQLVVWRMRNELIKMHILNENMIPFVYDTF